MHGLLTNANADGFVSLAIENICPNYLSYIPPGEPGA